MKPIKFVSKSYEDTLALSTRLAQALERGDVVCLYGELGAGKTAFVKGLVKGLKMNPLKVHSPTFTLMNIYEGKIPLYHFDLYRIKADDLFGLGYEEFFYGSGIAAVEWSERLEHLLPKVFWKVELCHAGEDTRHVFISVEGEALKERFKTFAQDHS